jgi:multidrug efflux pump subunit AcrA (membrane-fusion protein)
MCGEQVLQVRQAQEAQAQAQAQSYGQLQQIHRLQQEKKVKDQEVLAARKAQTEAEALVQAAQTATSAAQAQVLAAQAAPCTRDVWFVACKCTALCVNLDEEPPLLKTVPACDVKAWANLSLSFSDLQTPSPGQ